MNREVCGIAFLADDEGDQRVWIAEKCGQPVAISKASMIRV